jgi:hypothetical protein
MVDLQIIELKNNLLVDYTYCDTKKKIVDRLVELKLNDIKYKNDNEFLNLVCNLIEHLIKKKDKISKKDLVLIIFQEMFNINEEEKVIISNNIEYLFNNKNIKKVSFYKLFKTSLNEWFRKK